MKFIVTKQNKQSLGYNYTIQMKNIEYKWKLYNTNKKLYNTNGTLQNTNRKYRIQMEII
jgi:hypothetical protein